MALRLQGNIKKDVVSEYNNSGKGKVSSLKRETEEYQRNVSNVKEGDKKITNSQHGKQKENSNVANFTNPPFWNSVLYGMRYFHQVLEHDKHIEILHEHLLLIFLR